MKVTEYFSTRVRINVIVTLYLKQFSSYMLFQIRQASGPL